MNQKNCSFTSAGHYDESKPQRRKRQEENENDYMVNLKAELQVRSLHQKIDVMQKRTNENLI
jgi:uncharacterized membrane protein